MKSYYDNTLKTWRCHQCAEWFDTQWEASRCQHVVLRAEKLLESVK